MILVWGLATDPPVAAVMQALARTGAPVLLLDQDTDLDACFIPGEDPSPYLTGALQIQAGRVAMADIMAAYIRPVDLTTMLAGRPADPAATRRLIDVQNALLGWSDITPARVLNRPEAMASNNSKPYQSLLIQRHGFAIPETLLTTSVDALHAFHARHGRLIYKSTSGIRSIVAPYNRHDHARDLDLTTCPTMFQRFVPGTDIRVHVIGEDVFACEIVSDATDYRYPTTEAEHPTIRHCRLPPDIEQRCRTLAAALHLDFAGIDLRRTDDDAWVCFEVNPSPGFTFYENATGLPLAKAVADVLMSAARRDDWCAPAGRLFR